jgi:hypothetical protein
MWVGGQLHAPAAFTPEKDPVLMVQEAGWASGPFWTGVANLARTFQPVAIRYTDYVIPALLLSSVDLKKKGWAVPLLLICVCMS